MTGTERAIEDTFKTLQDVGVKSTEEAVSACLQVVQIEATLAIAQGLVDIDKTLVMIREQLEGR